jgi:cytochrome oxidase Cu insertion factor (SCO1/SenC/PrrC family)
MPYGNDWLGRFCGRQARVVPARLLVICVLCAFLSCDSGADAKKSDGAKGTNGHSQVASATDEGHSQPASAKPGAQAPPPPILFKAPQFNLTAQTGSSFGTDDLRGRVWVANFMFTRCAATCPRQTAKIAELQGRAQRWPDWERLRLISFSVDPERDTAAVLKEYAGLHGADEENWKFLTGTRQELFRISKDGFKLPVSEAARDGSKPITHSPQFILVDADGRVRGYYDSQSEDDFLKLLTDVRSVLSEPTVAARGTVHVGRPAEIFDTPWLEQRKSGQLADAPGLDVFHDFQFSDRLEASGIDFVSRAAAESGRDRKFNHYDHGTGIAAADVDGDGLSDVYFVSQVGGNQLWRNLGRGRFENITEQAGVGLKGRLCVSASFADTDNDGDPDLFVSTTRFGNILFENEGQGRFRNVTLRSGLVYSGHSSSAEFFDYDRDGRLDLFLVNVGRFTTDDVGYSGNREKKEHPYFIGADNSFLLHLVPARSERSILYHNEGENRFRDVSEEMGLVHEGWSGDATPVDLNEDGWTDIYVLGMQGNDEYYENIGGRKFERKSENVFPRSPWGAMGVKSFDFNNDGHLDLFITNMHADMWQFDISAAQEKQKPPQESIPESYLHSRNPGKNIFGNALFRNFGKGRWRDVSDEVNAENYWPWGLSVGDLNADGYQDVFITSSMNYAYHYQVNSLLLNDRGRRFRDAEFILGVEPRRDGRTATPWFELDCNGADADNELSAGRSGRVVVWGALGSRSSVIFDIDEDGDLDIVTNDFNSSPMVLTSDLSERHPGLRYVKIQLQGRNSNRDGLGAKVEVTAGGHVFTQVHDGQSGYLSQSSLPLYFGLDRATTIDRISVQWPGGTAQVLDGPLATNQTLVIVQEDEGR